MSNLEERTLQFMIEFLSRFDEASLDDDLESFFETVTVIYHIRFAGEVSQARDSKEKTMKVSTLTHLLHSFLTERLSLT